RYDVLPGWPAGAVAKDIVLRDESLAYVAAGTAGTAVLSLEDPAAPFVRRVEPPPEGLDVQAVDASADQLAAGSSDGVLLYDLSDPLAPRLVSVALRGVSAVGLDLDEGWLHVAADMDGLRLLDVTDPSEPAEVAAVTAPYSFNSVVASGQRVYAAGAGLLIFELDAVPDPTATTTPSATPVTPTETATGTPTTEPTPTQPPTATTDPHLDAKRCLVPLVLR
ncbi:MAG: LVIVD repeat-containing protein, partial [Anaerolineae bacterium]